MDKTIQSFNLAKANIKLVDNGDGTFSVATSDKGGGVISVVNSPAPVTVTTSSGTVLPANANRKNGSIVNSGAADVYIRRGTPAAVGRGIFLKAGGGNHEINSTNLYKGIITAVTESGTSTLVIEEGE